MKKIFYFLIAFVCINCSKDDDSSGECFVCDFAETTMTLDGVTTTELIPFNEVSSEICAGTSIAGTTYTKAILQALLDDPDTGCEGCNCRLE